MHGPPASYTGNLYGPVEWPQTIPVLDTVIMTLGLRNRRRWRKLREEALGKWSGAGFTFDVSTGDPVDYPTFDPEEPDEHTRLMAPIVPGVLRLMDLVGLPAWDLYGGALYAHPGAWAAIDMSIFWNLSADTRRYAMVHEIGHCFGLAHRQNVEGTAMWRGLDPDAHDLDSLRSYYNLEGSSQSGLSLIWN